jgi:Rha family phage regulatory protein
MTNLQLVFKQDARGVLMTDSMRLAEGFGQMHKNTLRKIESTIVDTDPRFTAENFEPVEFIEKTDGGLEVRTKYYQMTRDGFMLIALAFTGKKGCAFRVKVIDAFNKMEAELQKRGVQTNTGLAGLLKAAAEELEAKDREIATVTKEKEVFRLGLAQVGTEIKQRPIDLLIDNTVAAVDIEKNHRMYPGIIKKAQEFARRNPNTFNVIELTGCITRVCMDGGCTEIKAIGPKGYYRCQYNRADVDRLEAILSRKVVV